MSGFLYFRLAMLLVLVCCSAVFGYALYLQYVVGLMPCPMCIVQRYAFTAVGLSAFLAACSATRGWQNTWVFFLVIGAGFGAFVAGRQSWLQWFPPEFASCGRDFYSMVQDLPLSRWAPLLFQGSGDCSAVEWKLWGLSIANYSFLIFTGIILFTLICAVARPRYRRWFFLKRRGLS